VADDHDAERKSRVRNAIVQHLLRFPLAGDTPSGIATCWLPSPGYEGAAQIIEEVVETMVAAGELMPRNLPDGSVLFVRGSALASHE
jgi:hypothetical protein